MAKKTNSSKKTKPAHKSSNSNANVKASEKDTKKEEITVEKVYGKKRLSDKLVFKHTFVIDNPQHVEFCLVENEKDEDSLAPLKLTKSTKILPNTGSQGLEKSVVKLIDNAEDVVCVCSFLFEKDTELSESLYRASKRGVRVYMLLASQVFVEQNRGEEDNKIVGKHVEFLNEAGKGYMFIRSGGVHAKFVLVDPKGENPRGMLLTANLTKRALNDNNELGIHLSPSETTELFQQFLYGFYSTDKITEYRYNTISGQSRLEPVPIVERKLPKLKRIVVTNSEETTIGEEIHNLIGQLKEDDELLISGWNFSLDNPVSKEILDHVNEKTRIMLHESPKNHEAIREFLKKGASIRFHPLHHAKFILSPSRALIFSANFEKRGLDEGYEAGIHVESKDDLVTLISIFDYWYAMAEMNGLYDKPIAQLEGREILVLENHENKKEGLRKIKIIAETELKAIKQTWPLEKFVNTKDINVLSKLLQSEGLLSPVENSVESKCQVEILPRKLLNTENLLHEKEIDGFHIWKEEQKSKKSKTKRLLVFNKDPTMNEQELSKASTVARKENAHLVLY
ncbi:MAG: phospholipase D-like domain-containing protein [Promethearchaeota archaeon]